MMGTSFRTMAVKNLTLVACFCVCAITAWTNFANSVTSFGSANPAPRVVFVVLTGKSWETIGIQGWRTWHRHVVGPLRLVLASDTLIPGVPENLVFLQTGENNHASASRRFLDALLKVDLLQDEYMFLIDDDAFVVTYNVYAFVRELEKVKKHSVGVRSIQGRIYGEFRCPDLCGGGGVLLDPSALHLLRAAGNLLLDGFDNARHKFYDTVLSEVIKTSFMDITTTDCAGLFNSQPPNHYAYHSKPGLDLTSSSRQMMPMTFHYVDEMHQSANNASHGYNCDPCVSLIPELYTRFYEEKVRRVAPTNSTFEIACISSSKHARTVLIR